MGINKYEKTETYHCTYVTGGKLEDLIEAAQEFLKESDAAWSVENSAVVITAPLGSQLIPRS